MATRTATRISGRRVVNSSGGCTQPHSTSKCHPCPAHPRMSATLLARVMGSNGFARIPAGLNSSKVWRFAVWTLAVRKMTGKDFVVGCAWRCSNVVGPSQPGIMTSRRMASGRVSRATSTPSAPQEAVRTRQPATTSRLTCATSRMSSSSSTIRIRRVWSGSQLTMSPARETDVGIPRAACSARAERSGSRTGPSAFRTGGPRLPWASRSRRATVSPDASGTGE